MSTTPPLLLLAEGRKPRALQASAPRSKELDLHIAVADTLRRFAKVDWRWAHYPAGEHRDPRVAAKLKAMGVQRGWPDFLLFSPNGRLHVLEIKRIGENLSDDQKEFRRWAEASCRPYAVARTVDEALAVLSAWKCLRINIAIRGRAP